MLPVILLVLFVSLLANLLLGFLFYSDIASSLDQDSTNLTEKFLLGDKTASDKVAVIRIEGVISGSSTGYPLKQMEKAANDRHVKAIVLRVDSPGGTVTASEELYQDVVNLRDNNGRRFQGTGPKPVSVSMGGVAASGGYYVAAAGKPISADPTTITGSIGVFAALPNVAKFAHEHGVKVELVKAGDIKASGSFFHDMAPEERQTWQDTVDSAYNVFLDRVAAGRSLKKEQLRDDIVISQNIPVRDEKGNPEVKDGKPVTVAYKRKRADGGTFTAEQALKFGLIDQIEDLPATIRASATAAGLNKYKAVTYERPVGLADLLFGGQIRTRQDILDLRGLSSTLTPRLWYLSPTADGAILTPNP
ncbi:MAG: sppA 2 [Gemmataceae bacterium]|nr:sppA 2 [Gemmataceae bacterium]